MAGKIDTVLGYQSWPANTSIKLCNVTWDQSYRDIVRFKDKDARDAYLDGLEGVEFREASYTRANAPVNLHIPFNRASRFNYMIVNNDYSFDDKRKWYYFIQGVEYVNANVTRFYIALDVWQSFCYDVRFGRAYVERGHIGIANERQMEDGGRPYLDIPEGLDLGGRTSIAASASFKFMENAWAANQDPVGVMVVSTTSLLEKPGDKFNPSLNTAEGSYTNGLPNGVGVYYFKTASDFLSFMRIASSYPWVSQGVVGIWLVPNSMVQADADGARPVLGGEGAAAEGNVSVYRVNDASQYQHRYIVHGFRQDLMKYVPRRYHNLRKLTIYPYMMYELTARDGSSLIYEPQYIWSEDLDVREETWAGMPNPQARFYFEYYAGGEEYNAAINIQDWPKLAMVNNNSSMYVAQNAHSIDQARRNADWSNQKTQMGINNAQAQAGIGADYASRQTALGNRNRNAMNAISNQSLQTSNNIAAQQQYTDFVLGMAGHAASAVMGGGQAGIAGSAPGAVGPILGNALGAASDYVSNQQRTQTREATLSNTLATNGATTAQANSFATSSTDLSNSQSLQFADMNATLGRAVASGDYAQTIAGINAKIQDSAMNAPSISGAIGGDVMRYVKDKWNVYVNVRTIPPAAVRDIGEFWLRYGYYVQRFIQPPQDLACMERFTYWKMHELYLSSSTCPEQYRMTIKGIFEKGVTVWRNPDDIGRIDYADNEPLPGISY